MSECFMENEGPVFIHPTADVKTKNIGPRTKVWQNAVILPDAIIGSGCNICANTFIENDVVLGNNVCLKCGVYLWDGLRVGDNVFIGPNASFCNDLYPQAGVHDERRKLLPTVIEEGVSIGSGAVILPGVRIGKRAIIGAGAVVIRDVPACAVVVGNPSRITGYVNAEKFHRTTFDESSSATNQSQGKTGARLYDIPHFGDMRGDLNVLEIEKTLPFPVRRIFYTYNVGSQEVRGEHAHRVCEQFLLAIHGSLHVIVDDGSNREEYLLDSPSVGLHLPSGCWGIEYKHSNDCVLVVLASHPYMTDDYIRDYDEFLAYKKGFAV